MNFNITEHFDNLHVVNSGDEAPKMPKQKRGPKKRAKFWNDITLDNKRINEIVLQAIREWEVNEARKAA